MSEDDLWKQYKLSQPQYIGHSGINKISNEDYLYEIRKRLISFYPEWSKSMKQNILAGKITHGMTEMQVILTWGYPIKTYQYVSDYVVYKTWHYGPTGSRQEIKFRDGIVDSF